MSDADQFRLSSLARVAAALVALTGVAGLAIQTLSSLELTGSIPAALWAMARYFTIIGNALTALVLLAAALGLRAAARPRILGGITLIMALIGIIFALLLRNVQQPPGFSPVGDIILHYAIPPLVALFWLVFAPKGGLSRVDPLRWALLPLAYFPYALARAAQDGVYPYPFIDVDRLGWPTVLTNAAIIAAGFIVAGLLLVWLDRKLGRRIRAAAP